MTLHRRHLDVLLMQGLYPHAAQISRATFDMLYNPEPQQQPPGEEQQPPH